MPFHLAINGPMFKMFLQCIATTASTTIITFGPEKITCNHIADGGDLMSSALIPPIKSNLTNPISIKLNVEKILEEMGEEDLPDEVIVAWSGKELVAFLDVAEADIPEELYIFSQTGIETAESHPEAPRINYPLRISIDLEVLKSHLSKLKSSKGVILSYENGPFYLATGDWSDRTEIPGNEFYITHLTKGEYSSLFDRELLTSVIDAMEAFESVLLAIGEDLPLIIAGVDPSLKLGYMIAQQV